MGGANMGGANMGGATSAGGTAGRSECEATVVAVDGDYTETLECEVRGEDCECTGAGERSGTYTVTATLGEQVESETAKVTADKCHVTTQNITFFD
jgi:hypothetical protein